MSISLLIHRIAWAIGVSIAALTAAVVIQAIVLFPQDFQTLNSPHQTSIRRLSLLADGKRAIALVRRVPAVLPDEPEFALVNCELAETNPLVRIELGISPWIIASARRTDRLFVATQAGDLYAFDATAQVPKPRLLGRQVYGSSYILESTQIGSLVIFGDVNCIGVWSTESANRLWQRSDIRVLGAHFHASTDRLFCGLVEGSCVELDRHTGATLRAVAAHTEGAHLLDVTADEGYLATLGCYGLCVITDLQSGDELWSTRLPIGAGPRFSPDGKCVLAPDPAGAAVLRVHSTTTGELLDELHGAKAQIARIEVTVTGIVYVWDTSGTLTAWDLDTRKLLRQYDLTS